MAVTEQTHRDGGGDLSFGEVPPEQNPGLEALRFLAVSMLVLYHLACLLGGEADSPLVGRFYQVSHSLWFGTDIFFAIMGYLVVCTTLAKKGQSRNALQLLLRRGLRILPSYFVFLLVFLHAIPWLVTATTGSTSSIPLYEKLAETLAAEHSLWNLTVNLDIAAGNWIGCTLEPLFALTLGVQVLLGAIILLRSLRLPLVVWVLVLAEGLAIYLRLTSFKGDPWAIYFGTLTRYDAFLAGMAMAIVARHPAGGAFMRKHIGKLLIISTMALLGVVLSTSFLTIKKPLTILAGYPVIAIFSALLVFQVIQLSPRIFGLSLLGKTGKFAYSVYLIKLPLLYTLIHMYKPQNTLQGIGGVLMIAFLGLIACHGVGAIWFYLVEYPLTIAGKHFLSRPTGQKSTK